MKHLNKTYIVESFFIPLSWCFSKILGLDIRISLTVSTLGFPRRDYGFESSCLSLDFSVLRNFLQLSLWWWTVLSICALKHVRGTNELKCGHASNWNKNKMWAPRFFHYKIIVRKTPRCDSSPSSLNTTIINFPKENLTKVIGLIINYVQFPMKILWLT